MINESAAGFLLIFHNNFKDYSYDRLPKSHDVSE